MNRSDRPVRVAGGALPVGPLRLGRVIWAELSLAAVLLSLLDKPTSLRLVGAIAVVAIAVAAAPIRGRSGLELLRTALVFKLRSRDGFSRAGLPGTAAAGDAEGTRALLRTLIPGLILTTAYSYSAVPIGVIGLNGSWTVVLAVQPDQPIVVLVGAPDTVPIGSLVPLLDAAGITLDSIQVVVVSAAGPSALPSNSAVLTSHLELPGGLPMAGSGRLLIALRLDPRSCPQAIAARGGGVIGAHRALAASAARAIEALANGGLQMRTLNADETADVITSVAGLRRPILSAGARRTNHWHHVRVGPSLHRTFLVSGWGSPQTAGNPLDQLGNLRALSVSTSLTLTGTPVRPLVTGSVRITTSEVAEMNAAEQQLLLTADRLGLELGDANGLQYEAFLAGLPPGGRSNDALTDRYPRFRADPQALRSMGVTISGCGLIIGETAEGRGAAVDLLRATPTRAVVVGSLTLALTITIRSLGLGARVVVSTWRPEQWTALARRSGVPDRLVTRTGEHRPPPPQATETTPVLAIHDVSSESQKPAMPSARWRTSLHVLPDLHPSNRPILAAADVLILQRIDIPQATGLGHLLHLPDRVVGRLSRLGPTEVMVISRAGSQCVTVVATPTETRLLQEMDQRPASDRRRLIRSGQFTHRPGLPGP